MLKGGSLSSRILYRREFDSYQDEWFQCQQEIKSLIDMGPVNLSNYVKECGLGINKFQMPSLIDSLKLRITLSPFLRLSWYLLPIYRVSSLITRYMNKYLYRKKKIFPGGGLVIAISGIDGIGKSTMLKEVNICFGKFITIDCLAIGKPQNRFIETIRKLVSYSKNSRNIEKNNRLQKVATPGYSISSVILALLRLKMARKAVKRASEGKLIIVDRWPTDTIGMMDGPRINIESCNSYFINIAAHIEHWIYQSMPRADLCIFLHAPVQILVDRNRDRIKNEKETDEEITSRFEQNQNFEPIARKTIYFENDGPLVQKRKELLLLIWREISARSF